MKPTEARQGSAVLAASRAKRLSRKASSGASFLLRGQSDATAPEEAAADVAAMKQCQWAINPVPAPNLLILGGDVAYEGFKRGGTRGFEHTHCEIDPAALTRLIDGFEAHFEDCCEPGTTPSELADTMQAYLEQAESEQRGRS